MSLPVTEDTPPDMLAGSMDLKVVLPDGRGVKMSVQRGTPMMDLLVQVTTAHCLSPGDYSLQAMGDKGVLPFKPNTPIGTLDTFTVKIVEKKLHTRGRAPQVPQSFLNTFRLQVHLPRSQLFVLRVTPDVTLSEIMTHICTEKNLNIDKYEFRNPGNLDEILELDKTLGDYKLQELSMLSKGNRSVTGLMSSADIINVKSSKHRQNSVCDSSLSSGSFGSRSGSPIPPINVVTMPPQPPIRKKRRPAPKPPTFSENEKKDQTTSSVLISHSRESSDSSGYHEASVLSESPTHESPAGRIESDSPPDTLPRRSKLPSSQSFTNLTSIQPAPKSRLTSSISNTSLNSNGYSRKKRAPPPPPVQSSSRENKIKSSTLPTSVSEERRNGSNFTSENPFSHFEINASVEVANSKVQNPVENTSELIDKTKASKDEIPACLGKIEQHILKRNPPGVVRMEKNENILGSFNWETLVDDYPFVPSQKSFSTLGISLYEIENEKKSLQLKGLRRSIAMSNKSSVDSFKKEITVINSGNKMENVARWKAFLKYLNGQEDVDVRLPPKPKPRTSIPKTPPKNPSQRTLVTLDLRESDLEDFSGRSGTLNRWKNVENLAEEEIKKKSSNQEYSTDECEKPADMISKSLSKSVPVARVGIKSQSSIAVNMKAVKNILLVGHSEPSRKEPDCGQDQTDHDSINWEYQLPPPPTDFRDTSSPSCTEFGTITITPEVLENVDEEFKKEPDERFFSKAETQMSCQMHLYETECNEFPRKAQKNETESYHHRQADEKFSQNKSVVMNELTNILNGNRKFKEKSLSISNLYINESSPKDCKKSALNYSRSFSTEPVPALENFKLTTYQTNGLGNNKKLSISNEIIYNNEISYRNYKNLEKSSSMECIQINNSDNYKIIDKTEDIFRKPVAPVQKKLKIAKRSASSVGVNSSNFKTNSLEVNQNGDWSEDENINILREQFLEFLKEKKLNSDLNMKSLDVIRNILPELSGVENDARSHLYGHVNVVVHKNNETNSQENAQKEEEKKDEKEEKIKIVDVKVKGSLPAEEISTDKVLLRHEIKTEPKIDVKTENGMKPSEKNQEIAKRYSYQGPPSINFSTWGERPKTTRIIIKDEDYVTREKVTEKKSETVIKNVDISANQKPKELKKPAQIIIKKPGVLSRYEMFSALPKRKEISSLELVHMEDEERKKKIEKIEAKEFSRVPVVCGMELKKEFKPPSPVKSSISSPESEIRIQPEINKTKHSVSVYVNGNQEIERDKNSIPNYSFVVPKRNSTLMPVVKGFRPLEESITNHVNVTNSSTSNHININLSSRKEPMHQSNATRSKNQTNEPIPPPPPSISLIKLKPVSFGMMKPKAISQDPRSQLLDEIKNFGGLRKLKRSTVQ